jgi:hypothetical protein
MRQHTHETFRIPLNNTSLRALDALIDAISVDNGTAIINMMSSLELNSA